MKGRLGEYTGDWTGQMDKLERLLNLTAALLHTARPLTASELRDKVGGYPSAKQAFRRSFERDKEDLRAIGIPLRVESAPGHDPPIDGYRILAHEYSGRELQFEPGELAALHLAGKWVQLEGVDTVADGASEVFAKIGEPAGIAEPAGIRSSLADTDPLGHVPFHAALGVLFEAASRQLSSRFVYNEEPREVEPWRLSFTKGHWYLTAWDRIREDRRTFRVDRIIGPVDLADRAVHDVDHHPATDPFSAWEFGEDEPVRARIAIDPDQAAWARHVTGSEGEAQPDGSVVLTLSVRDVAAFRSLILSFLDHAEVLEPASLRQDMIAWLEARIPVSP